KVMVDLEFTTSTPSPSSSGIDANSQTSQGKTKAIIGGVVGGTTGLLAISLVMLLLCRRSSISFQHLMINRRRHQSFGITALPLRELPLLQPTPFTIHSKSAETVGQNQPAETSLSPMGMREQKKQILDNRADTGFAEMPQPDNQTYPNLTETGQVQPDEQSRDPEILAHLRIVVQRLAHIEARLGEEAPPDYSSNRS
ncbi:hypothetical protein V5O48_017119, partial [Marasmius crinis-equi]